MFGPFQSEESGKIIMNLAKDQLLPIITQLEKLVVRVVDYSPNFFSSFFRKELDNLYMEFKNQNRNFFVMYHLYSTPDELFKNILIKNNGNIPGPSEQDKNTMADYMKSKPMMNNSFEEGFKLLEIIERNLNRYFQSADQRVATILSILAITVSVVIVLFK